MRRNVLYQYLVEGDTEKKIVQILKDNMKDIVPGKVQRFNVIQEEISDFYLRTIKPGTIVVLVFDTDVCFDEILRKNIKKLLNTSSVKCVVKIPQVKNLEDELVFSCNIKKITELLNSQSVSAFKSDILRINNLQNKLVENSFDINKFWSRNPYKPFQDISNNAEIIKLLT